MLIDGKEYSECGKGDSAAPFGWDNIRYEKVFDHLKSYVKLMVGKLSKDS